GATSSPAPSVRQLLCQLQITTDEERVAPGHRLPLQPLRVFALLERLVEFDEQQSRSPQEGPPTNQQDQSESERDKGQRPGDGDQCPPSRADPFVPGE